MQSRLDKKKKWRPIKPTRTMKIIEDLDNEFDEWTRSNTNRAMKKFANDYFGDNIGDPEIKEDPRNWHRCL